MESMESTDAGVEKSNCILNAFNESLFQNNECYMCNGFHGPCFGQPVCATCHTFLFPDFALNGKHFESLTEQKSDDSDSGNDEPADTINPVERHLSNDKGDYSSEAGTSSRTQPPPSPDSVAYRLELLTSSLPQKNLSKTFNTHIDNLPSEVLLIVFSYLDDFSLWNVANVCRRWRTLTMYKVPTHTWKELTIRRFPLFKPILAVHDWLQMFTVLMKHCSCYACLQQMVNKIHPPGEGRSWGRYRLLNELKFLRSDPPDGIQAIPLDLPTCCHWQATIQGPAGSPYEGGIFFLYLQVPYSYPMSPPVVRFLTKIFHPNISRHGDVGIDSIQHNWSLVLTLSKVLISVQSLLTDPYCEVCMEPEVGKLYLTNRSKFETIARQWTRRYAIADIMPYLS